MINYNMLKKKLPNRTFSTQFHTQKYVLYRYIRSYMMIIGVWYIGMYKDVSKIWLP